MIVHYLRNIQENSYRDNRVFSHSLLSVSAHIFLYRNSWIGFDKIYEYHCKFIILNSIQLVIRIWQLHKLVRRG